MLKHNWGLILFKSKRNLINRIGTIQISDHRNTIRRMSRKFYLINLLFLHRQYKDYSETKRCNNPIICTDEWGWILYKFFSASYITVSIFRKKIYHLSNISSCHQIICSCLKYVPYTFLGHPRELKANVSFYKHVHHLRS